MLRRFCDRCAAEMPIEQTMDERELILRRLNEKPFDLCKECQRNLRVWMEKPLWAREGNDDKRNNNAE